MKKPILMLIIACFLCGGAWAAGKTKSKSNVSRLETSSPADITEILAEPVLHEDEGMYTIMSLAWNQKMRKALTSLNWALKYMATQLKAVIDHFEKNMEIMRDLHRRRRETLHAAFLVKQRRIKKVKTASPLKVSPPITPVTVRLMTKATFLSYLAANINSTNGQPYSVPKKYIVAMM